MSWKLAYALCSLHLLQSTPSMAQVQRWLVENETLSPTSSPTPEYFTEDGVIRMIENTYELLFGSKGDVGTMAFYMDTPVTGTGTWTGVNEASQAFTLEIEICITNDISSVLVNHTAELEFLNTYGFESIEVGGEISTNLASQKITGDVVSYTVPDTGTSFTIFLPGLDPVATLYDNYPEPFVPDGLYDPPPLPHFAANSTLSVVSTPPGSDAINEALSVSGPPCSELITGTDGIILGTVCTNVAGDSVDVIINVTNVGPSCCMKETHVCNVPMEFDYQDAGDCATSYMYSFSMMMVHDFMCTGDPCEKFQLDGHATVVCDEKLDGDYDYDIEPGDPLAGNGDVVEGGGNDAEYCYGAMFWLDFGCEGPNNEAEVILWCFEVAWPAINPSPECQQCLDDFETEMKRIEEDLDTALKRAEEDRRSDCFTADALYATAIAANVAAWLICLASVGWWTLGAGAAACYAAKWAANAAIIATYVISKNAIQDSYETTVQRAYDDAKRASERAQEDLEKCLERNNCIVECTVKFGFFYVFDTCLEGFPTLRAVGYFKGEIECERRLLEGNGNDNQLHIQGSNDNYDGNLLLLPKYEQGSSDNHDGDLLLLPTYDDKELIQLPRQ